MFFMTRNRFEDELNKRIAEWNIRRNMEDDLGNIRRDMYRLEDRIARLEGKGYPNAVVAGVCNVKDC